MAIKHNDSYISEVIKMDETVILKVMDDDTIWVFDLNAPLAVRRWRLLE